MPHAVVKKIDMTGVLTGQDVRIRRNLKDMNFIYLAVLCFFLIVAVASVFLWSRLMIVNIGYDISKGNASRAILTEQNKRLRVDYTKLKSPDRIEKIAAEELALLHPSGEQIVNLR